MAISREGSNLPNKYFIPEIFAKEVQVGFKKESVAAAIINRTYEGELKTKGDTVYIRKIGTLSTRPIAVGGKTVWTDLEDDRIVMTIDNAEEIAFRLSDIDQTQSDIKNIMDLYSEEGTYAVSDRFDSYVLDLHGDALAANKYGSTGSPIDVGFDTSEVSPTNVITRMGRLLTEQNVPRKGRWMTLPPLFIEQLLQDDSAYAQANVMGDGKSKLLNGSIGRSIGGFEIYESNNIATNGTYYACMCGTKAAISGAQQITKTEKLRLQDIWADGIRMLSVFDAKVVKPEALGVAYCKFD